MLPVHERFLTFQGEGVHLGRRAYFVRLFGCPLHCPWCDSAGTWHPQWVPKQVQRLSEAEIVGACSESCAEVLVVTGGEPAIHDLRLLTATAHDLDIHVHLETSGAFPLRGTFDWVTVSPKDQWAPDKPCLRENWLKADEFKFIIEKPEDIGWWALRFPDGDFSTKPRWLHPEWGRREDPELLRGITEYVKTMGDPWRAGWQLHKNYRADQLDAGSAPAVPLGGDLKRGY